MRASSAAWRPHAPHTSYSHASARCSAREGVAVRAARSAGAVVNDEKTPEEVLQAADLIILPGRETAPHHAQGIHRQKRLIASSLALRRLAKMLVGVEQVEERARATSTEAFATLCAGALSIGDDDGVNLDDTHASVFAETMRAIGTLAPPREHVSEEIKSLARTRAEAFGSATQAKYATAIKYGLDALGVDVPGALERALTGVPFRFMPRLASGLVTMDALRAEVKFRTEQLVTRDGTRVDERRQTCWMADDGVGGLAYSGKIMQPVPMTPVVAAVRDALEESTGERFDCCLLNLYGDGDVACKYHQDPDHGRLWATDSIIVSIGETRRFSFRPLGTTDEESHWVRVQDGDCVSMFSHCNEPTTGYEHCVMKSEGENNCAPRASIVFKRSISHSGGKRGHGLSGAGRKAAKSKNKNTSRRAGKT